MYRISPSLLDSFGYYLSIEDADKSAECRQEIIDGLRGVKKTNEAMQAGTSFEDAVVKAIQFKFEPSDDKIYDACVVECADEVRGSIYQYHVEIEIGGIVVDGYIDFLLRNMIIDLKTCDKYDIGKYQDRNQHLAYLACLHEQGIDRFRYLITDFRNVYKEDYFWNPVMLDTLKANANQLLGYLENDSEMKTALDEMQTRKENHRVNGDVLKQALILRG